MGRCGLLTLKLLLLLAGVLASVLHGSSTATPQLQDDDFVVAMSTARSRMLLAQATRAYRENIRTLVMTDMKDEVPHLNKVYGKYREVYEYYADENDPDPKRWHAKNPGDFRAGMAPFAAHRQFGETYKWMLYGDDDTFFFLPNVRKLLAGFDPDLPLAITDNLWFDSRHPRLEAFRCLPCGFNDTALPPAQTNTSYTPRAACPYCTPAAACPPSNPGCSITGAHGGAGIILSVGLLRRLPYEAAETCMLSILHCSGGDCLASQCIWRAGYGFTDPGVSLLHPDPYAHVVFDSLEARLLLKEPLRQISLGNCDADCVSLLRSAVSLHVRAKSYPSFAKAAAFMFGLAEAHAAALAYLDLLEDEGGRASGGAAAPRQDL